MGRAYIYVPRERLEQDLADLYSRVQSYTLTGHRTLTGSYRREIRKINRELRRRDREGDKG